MGLLTTALTLGLNYWMNSQKLKNELEIANIQAETAKDTALTKAASDYVISNERNVANLEAQKLANQNSLERAAIDRATNLEVANINKQAKALGGNTPLDMITRFGHNLAGGVSGVVDLFTGKSREPIQLNYSPGSSLFDTDYRSGYYSTQFGNVLNRKFKDLSNDYSQGGRK